MIACPRCGYICNAAWHYCIACGWDLTRLIGKAEEERLQAIARATVGVIIGGRRNRYATAFPFGGKGLLLTNARGLIAADDAFLKVRTADNREFHASVVGYDLPSGVGLLRADLPETPPIPAAAAPPAPPDAAWAVCYPVEVDDDIARYLPVSLHRGHLSAIGQSGTFLASFEHLLRTDHAIENGCIGGPIVDATGRLAGMILGSPDDGITYALPLDGVQGVIDALLRQEPPLRPYFGVGLVMPDERRAARFGIDPAVRRPLVAYLIPDGPAARAGVRPGEQLTAIGGEAVGDVWEAGRLLLAAAPGGAGVSLSLSGPSGARQVTVQPARRPQRVMLQPIDELEETLEANLREVTTGPSARQGLLVADLVRGGRGEKDFFHKGDVIVTVDKRSVRTFNGYNEIIRGKFKEIFTGDAPGDKRYASSYVVSFEVRTGEDEKVTRDYVNLFPDFLAAPVY